MLQTIPEDKYKRVKIDENMEVTGFKSLSYFHDFSSGNVRGTVNNEQCHLSIKTEYGEGGSFELNLRNRTALLKLQEALDFALEIDPKEEDGNENNE